MNVSFSKTKMLFSALILCGALTAGAVAIPNPLTAYMVREAKAAGYLAYEPMEAYKMATTICTQCHTSERIKMYCPRCGPPFVAVVPHMQAFIDNYKVTKPDLEITNITEAQAVAIVQVWNALVGNWESDFREQDILKLIGGYRQLAALYKTPVAQRGIESALAVREDLKIGHMTNLMEMQKNLGKPQAAPGEPSGAPVDHSGHEHAHDQHSGHQHPQK